MLRGRVRLRDCTRRRPSARAKSRSGWRSPPVSFEFDDSKRRADGLFKPTARALRSGHRSFFAHVPRSAELCSALRLPCLHGAMKIAPGLASTRYQYHSLRIFAFIAMAVACLPAGGGALSIDMLLTR